MAAIERIFNKYSCRPFKYGDDCCQFAGEVVAALTGKNPMDRFSYSDESGAYDIIGRYGDLCGAMTHVLGEPYDGHKDGDVCLINADGRQAAAVIHRGGVVARVEGGLRRLPIDRALKVWCT